MQPTEKRKARTTQWFKMWAEARADQKLELLSDAAHRVWFRLLCKASETGGIVEGFRWKPLAYEVARGDLDLLMSTLGTLADMDMVAWSDDRIAFLKFAKRNPTSPSDSPEARTQRTRERREREALRASVQGGDLNDVSRHGNDNETERNAFHPVSRTEISGETTTKRHETRFVRHEEESKREKESETRRDTPLTPQGETAHAVELASTNDVGGDPVVESGQPIALEEKTKGASEVPPAGFDEFWRNYPRKDGKRTAIAAYRAARVGPAMFRAILDDVKRRRDSPDWLKDGGQFIPHAATYLRARRWEDEGLDASLAVVPSARGEPAMSKGDAARAEFLRLYGSKTEEEI